MRFFHGMLLLALASCSTLASAQTTTGPQLKPRQVPKPVPIPMPKPAPAPPPILEPTDPPARDVTDARTGIAFHLPAGWNLARHDGELSTFRYDGRSAPRGSQVRAVATLGFNPYPASTFSGALFYLTMVPHSTAALCAAQMTRKPEKYMSPATIDDVPFTRGSDEHGKICTEARDVAATALRGGSCIRFDMVVNTFCGGEVSGARDMTERELENVFGRLERILQTVKFSRK